MFSIGALSSFQGKKQIVKTNVASSNAVQLKPLVESWPTVKIKVALGAPDTENRGCTGNATCGPCFGICVDIIISTMVDDISGYPGLEMMGDYIDDSHFKLTFNNVDIPQLGYNNSVTVSQSIVLDGPVITSSYNKTSITLSPGNYPITAGANNTSYVIVNSTSL